jgi:hypothetical protein
MARIEDSIEYVLLNEGGSKYTNIPQDAGGPTKYGITWRALALYRGRKVTAADVKALTREEAIEVYRENYWEPMGLDEYVSQACATAVFDCAVNRGVGTGKKYVRQICMQLEKANVNECDETEFIRTFEKRMEQGYQAIVASNPSQKIFIRGWMNRARRLLTLIKPKKLLSLFKKEA